MVGGEGEGEGARKQHDLRFQWQSVGSVGSFLCSFFLNGVACLLLEEVVDCACSGGNITPYFRIGGER